MSFFKSLLAHIPAIAELESQALAIHQAAGNDISEGSPHAKAAAKSAWDFFIANVPELAQVADIAATVMGAPEVVPTINAAAGAVLSTDKLAASIGDGNFNTSTLASSVASLSTAVSTIAGRSGQNQDVINTANEVAAIATQVSGTSSAAGATSLNTNVNA